MKPVTKQTAVWLALILLAAGSRAWAQTDQGMAVETIMVTAEKRQADEQKVPMSMNAFDAMDLEDAGAGSTPEIARFIPNVYFKEATMENIIVVRGVSSVDGATVGPVGVYIDDINYPLQFMHNIELLDVERVELLRGPQGTLYGRNTESGVLNIVTQPPGNHFQGKVKASYSFYDTSHGMMPRYQAGASLDLPLVEDRLFLGIDGQGIKSDGFMKNTRSGKEDAAQIERNSFRTSARWLPSDRFEISFIADASDYDDGQGLYRIFTSQDGLKNDSHTENRGFYESRLDQKSAGQVLKGRYTDRSFDLVSITGHRKYEQHSLLGSGVGLSDYGKNIWDFDDQFFSQEFRLSSKKDSGPLEWLIGAYGFKEDMDIHFSKFDGFQIRNTRVDKKGAALFVNTTYRFLNRLSLTGGVRYDLIRLQGSQDLEGGDWGGNDISNRYAKDLDFNEWLPKVVLAYDMTRDAMVYTSAAKGYLEGGYNYAQAKDETTFVYDPEYTWNYEVGLKTSWFNKRLIANAALYYITMDDKQVSEYTAGGAVAAISNAAKAHSKGIELELKARPARGLDLFATFGYMDTKIDKWAAGTSDFSGNKMPNTPEYTYSLGAQYRNETGFFCRADILGTGEMYGNVQNSSHVKLDDYYLVNLRLGYESEHYDLVLWCKNVFDEPYYTSAFDYGDPAEAIGVAQNGAPRALGLTFTLRF